MANSVLNDPRFQSETAAFAYVESKLWPEGPTALTAGNANPASSINSLARAPALPSQLL